MPQFTDSNLHSYGVRAEVFGTVQHVVIERLNKDGSRRQQPGPREAGPIILNPAEADRLVELIGWARRQPPEPEKSPVPSLAESPGSGKEAGVVPGL